MWNGQINMMKVENRPTDAGISTMWAIHNFSDLNEFWNACRALGFQKIELNHQVSSVMLSRLSIKDLQFSSVHEPCPADISTKEMVVRDWLISSIDEDARIQGVKVVKKSIDLAQRLSAPVVIIHCGIVPFIGHHESKLRALFSAGKKDSDEYRVIKSEFEQARQSLVAPRLQSVKVSLAELLEYAAPAGVILGLENRYHYMDIPSIAEMAELLHLADLSRLGFIYDVGHAQAMDCLGFYAHIEWLQRFSSRMIGCHLHDAIGLTDHYAPGLGEIDFSYIAGFLPERAFRTLEVLPANTIAQVRSGLFTLAQAGCVRYL